MTDQPRLERPLEWRFVRQEDTRSLSPEFFIPTSYPCFETTLSPLGSGLKLSGTTQIQGGLTSPRESHFEHLHERGSPWHWSGRLSFSARTQGTTRPVRIYTGEDKVRDQEAPRITECLGPEI